MFKKSPSLSSQNVLSGKDVRALIEEILAQYPDVDKSTLKRVLGLHSKATVTKKKIAFGSTKTAIYETSLGDEKSEGVEEGGSDGETQVLSGEGLGGLASSNLEFTNKPIPIFFEAARGRIVPTVFALWRIPEFCKAVETWGPVSDKVIGGADLMLPGIIRPFRNPFNKGDIRCVRVEGNPYPFAVGEMAVSSEEAVDTGMKGKGVIIYHHYGDELWVAGGKFVPDTTSFLGTRVVSSNTSQEFPPLQNLNLKEDKPDREKDDKVAAPDNIGTDESRDTETKKSQVTENVSADAWRDDPNELVDRTFVQALTKVKDDDLPLDSKVFLHQFMIPARPKGSVLDLSNTRYKKIGKLMQQMKKKGLVKIEENGEVDMIVKINRKERTYREHQRWEDESGSIDNEEGVSKTGDVVKMETQESHRSIPGKLEISEVFAPTSDAIKTVLASAPPSEAKGKRGELLITEAAAKAALLKYVKDHGLLLSDKKMTIRTMEDKSLRDAIFQNSKKVGESFPEELSLNDAWEQLSSHMVKYHVIARPGEEAIVKKGEVRPVLITLEQRHGGRKHLTNIVHLEKFGIDPEKFSESCQKKFSAACSLQPMPGKQDAGLFVVQLQGDFAKEVRDWLMVEFGLAKHHVRLE